jgi:CBS domain-containing protein
MLRSVDISDYMNCRPAKVYADDTLFEAIDIITTHHLSGLCVVDHEEMLVGVLSEMDCLRAILTATYNNTVDIGTVRDVMTPEVITCNLHDNLVDVANDMISKGHRRRPVVDKGRLIGQVSCRQLLRVVSTFNRRSER